MDYILESVMVCSVPDYKLALMDADYNQESDSGDLVLVNS